MGNYSHSPVFETHWSMRQTHFLSSILVWFPPLFFYCLHVPCIYMILNFLSYAILWSFVSRKLSKLWHKSEYNFKSLRAQMMEKHHFFLILSQKTLNTLVQRCFWVRGVQKTIETMKQWDCATDVHHIRSQWSHQVTLHLPFLECLSGVAEQMPNLEMPNQEISAWCDTVSSTGFSPIRALDTDYTLNSLQHHISATLDAQLLSYNVCTSFCLLWFSISFK